MLAQTLLAIAACAAVYHVVVTLLIYDRLRRLSEPVRFVLLRAMAPKYAHQYRKITEARTGHAGPLFYHWIASINLLAIVVIVGVVLVKP